MSASKRSAAVAVAAIVAMPAPVHANDDLMRGLIGLGTAIIANEVQRTQPQPQPVPVQRYQPAPSRVARPVAQAQPDEVERRESRAEIQRRLNALGFDTGQPDGVFGPRTRQAIAAFQASLGRSADGRISREEIDLLYARTGGEAGPAAAPAGSFPQLAAPGAPGATPPFPQLGAAPDGATAPSAAFPTLGTAPGPATASAGAFPALGTPDAATPEGGNAFPALGSAPAGESGPAFPQLAVETSEPAASSFPAVADAPEADAAFPELGAAPAAPDSSMPALGFAAPSVSDPATAPPPAASIPMLDPSRPLEPTTLEAEIALLPYGAPDKQPRISGVALGDDAETREKALKEAGFDDCKTEDRLVSCERVSDTLTDTLSMWTDADGSAWAMHRVIDFADPAPRDLIEAQFSETYPEIMASPGHAQASRDDCHAAGLGARELVVMYEGYAAGMEHPDQLATDVTNQFAALCPLIYRVEIVPDGDGVGRVELAFSDFSGVIELAVESARKKEQAETERREKLSSDLKL